MKKNWLYLFAFALLLPSLSLGQGKFECYTDISDDGHPQPFGGTATSCADLSYSEEDYLLLNEFTIYVNFHFVENELGENFHMDPGGDPLLYAPAIIGKLLNFSNSYWASPQLNALIPNPAKTAARSPASARVRAGRASQCTGTPQGRSLTRSAPKAWMTPAS